jgi:hypothetical protein
LKWYWDDEVVVDADSASYALAPGATLPGIYELLVVVETSAGESLSTFCRITVTGGKKRLGGRLELRLRNCVPGFEPCVQAALCQPASVAPV